MNQLTAKTVERLKAAGWTPGRNVDIKKIEKAYANAGMTIHEKVLY